MKYGDLTSVGIDEIHDAFIDAFSDYDVPFSISRDDLTEMLLRRGWDPSSSVGVFDGDLLVAFTLNGIGIYQGLATAYDSGTGVRRGYRGRRLADAMLSFALERLATRGVSQYVLEVLTTNRKAEAIYRRAGFGLVRELQCWTFERDDRGEQPGVSMRHAHEADLERLSRFMDIAPSWQNTVDSIRRSAARKVILTAEVDRRTAGYAVLYPGSGDLPQLAVGTEFRRRGIGRALLNEAACRADEGRLRIINVDDRATGVRTFLENCGAVRFVRQFEMSRAIFTSI